MVTFDRDVWEKNIAEMGQRQPLLAEFLSKRLAERGVPGFSYTPSPNGAWIRPLGDGETPIFFDQAIARPSQRSTEKQALFFLMGVGYPPYLFHRLWGLPIGTLGCVVFEPDLDLLTFTLGVSSVYRSLPMGCHLSFIASEEAKYVREALDVNIRPLGAFIVMQGKTLENAGEVESNNDLFLSLWKSFAKEVRTHIDILGNSPEDTLIGVRQIALNAPWILKSPLLTDLADRFKGCPCICVASGPSLEKNVHLLKGIEDRCLIISADTALRRLLEEGIKPHAVVTLERPVATYNNYFRYLVDNWSDQCRDILLVSQGVSPPQIQGRWPGPTMVVGKIEVPVDQWFVGDIFWGNVLRSGMSVAHMALVFASVLGAKDVALIGQDLAYGEDGRSHAGSTAAQSAQATEKDRGERDKLEVPGALGGTVKTHNIWFLFIQIFEVIIPTVSAKVYDCTEGGALIKGTEVQPLSRFLDELVLTSPSFPCTPGELASQSPRRLDGEFLMGVLERVEETLRGIGQAQDNIDVLELMVDKVTSAAISPKQRRAIASEMSEKLDALNRTNPVLGFIGQSYANMAGMDIARTRWLESMDQVREWEKLHREMLKSHRICSRYMGQWAGYIKTYLERFVSNPVFFDNAKNLSLDDWFNSVGGDLDPSGEAMISFNVMMAQRDPISEDWPMDDRWRAALVLHGQGRAEEASFIMESIVLGLEGQELPSETMAQLLKDHARICSTHDLCFVPRYRLAKVLLENAKRYDPEDPEIQAMIGDSLAGLSEYLGDLVDFRLLGNPDGFDVRRAMADMFLNQGKLVDAMEAVLSLILDHRSTRPENCAPILAWLTKTALDCIPAVDQSIARCSLSICKKLGSMPDLFRDLMVPMPNSLLQFLPEGLKVYDYDAEKQPDGGR